MPSTPPNGTAGQTSWVDAGAGAGSAVNILETLAAAGGVRKIAAQRLGMSERTLRYKLAQYRLEAAGSEEKQD